VVVALIVLGSCLVFAQGSAVISGIVRDATGAVLPGVTVTIKHTESGLTRTVDSTENGSYRMPSLPVGPYEVTGEKMGFKQGVRRGINLAVAQEAVVDLTLDVGTLAEQVTVTEEAPLVNTTLSSTAGLITEQQVKDLPLNGRSFDQLLTLKVSRLQASARKPTDFLSMESTGSAETPPASSLHRLVPAGSCWAWKPSGNTTSSSTPMAPSMGNEREGRSAL